MTSPARGGPDTAGVDPAEIRRQRAAGWPDFHPEDYCHHCGRPNPNWWVDSEHWNRAVDGSDRGVVGILCPSCFCALWEQQTGRTAIIWRLSIDPKSRDARGPDTAGMREAAREEIARIVYDRDSFAGDLPWSRTAPTEQDRCRAIADAILALPVVQRLAVEKAAGELRAMGRAALRTTPGAAPVTVPVGDLYDRAAALAAAAAPLAGQHTTDEEGR